MSGQCEHCTTNSHLCDAMRRLGLGACCFHCEHPEPNRPEPDPKESHADRLAKFGLSESIKVGGRE